MALKVEKRGDPVTTGSLTKKDPLCHTCKVRKAGLFTTDAYGKPQCGDCARSQGNPIA